jgi:hypothetical protein
MNKNAQRDLIALSMIGDGDLPVEECPMLSPCRRRIWGRGRQPFSSVQGMFLELAAAELPAVSR